MSRRRPAYDRAPTCHYCESKARYKKSSVHLYGGRDYGPVWECPTCPAAYVGCHKGGKPKGTPANAGDRALRKAAHTLFDIRWNGDNYHRGSRKEAYRWLARKLDISQDDCHIAMMHGEDLRKVINLCLVEVLGGEVMPPTPQPMTHDRIRGFLNEIKHSIEC